MIKGCHHIGLYVHNIEKSLAFYTGALGGKVSRSFPIGDGKEIFLVRLCEGVVIELVPVGKAEEVQNEKWAHIALSVDDTAAMFETLVAAGAKVWVAPSEFTLGDVKAFLAYVHGPDGEIIELYQEL